MKKLHVGGFTATMQKSCKTYILFNWANWQARSL